MMTEKTKKLRLWMTLLVVNLVIIWGNSLLPGEVSGAISNGVKNFLAMLLPKGPENGNQGGGLIRKLAHFTEFTCLGICLSRIFRMTQEKKARWYYLPLLCGAFAAAIDETIQRFVPDRGPSILDVGLDTCGVITGILIITAIYKRKYKKQCMMEEKEV